MCVCCLNVHTVSVSGSTLYLHKNWEAALLRVKQLTASQGSLHIIIPPRRSSSFPSCSPGNSSDGDQIELQRDSRVGTIETVERRDRDMHLSIVGFRFDGLSSSASNGTFSKPTHVKASSSSDWKKGVWGKCHMGSSWTVSILGRVSLWAIRFQHLNDKYICSGSHQI